MANLRRLSGKPWTTKTAIVYVHIPWSDDSVDESPPLISIGAR